MNESSTNAAFLTVCQQKAIALLLVVAALVLAVGILSMGAQRGEVDDIVPTPIQFIVNINHARWQELAQLPGIGEELARRIITRREQHGPFTSTDQLREVKGIGPKTMGRIRPHVVVGD